MRQVHQSTCNWATGDHLSKPDIGTISTVFKSVAITGDGTRPVPLVTTSVAVTSDGTCSDTTSSTIDLIQFRPSRKRLMNSQAAMRGNDDFKYSDDTY